MCIITVKLFKYHVINSYYFQLYLLFHVDFLSLYLSLLLSLFLSLSFFCFFLSVICTLSLCHSLSPSLLLYLFLSLSFSSPLSLSLTLFLSISLTLFLSQSLPHSLSYCITSYCIMFIRLFRSNVRVHRASHICWRKCAGKYNRILSVRHLSRHSPYLPLMSHFRCAFFLLFYTIFRPS